MSEPRLSGGLSPRTTALVAAGVLLVAAAIVALIFTTEPEARREGAVRKTAMLVETTAVSRGTYRPEIVAMGEVRPAEDTTLAPRVGGEVVERAPAFDPGGFVAAGDLLLRIDPTDHRHALAIAESALADARAALALEEGQQAVARAERERADGTLSDAQEALVLRTPQRQAAEARVAAAEATVARARLDLARSRITAPYDAQVLSRTASLGDQLSPGEPVGRIVGLDRWQVMASVPVKALSRLSPVPAAGVGGSGEQGAGEAEPTPVRIRDRAAWAEGQTRAGRLVGVLPVLDTEARMARVLVEVEDPLARAPDTAGPPLVAGAWVEVRFEGTPIADVVRLDRDLLRKDDTVWVMEEGVLRIREVTLAGLDATHAYVREGLSDGDEVVRTHLSTVTDGAPLRREGEGEDDGGGAPAEATE